MSVGGLAAFLLPRAVFSFLLHFHLERLVRLLKLDGYK